jgi:ankyrin repeat/BTB/POZ domain-containing protein 1
VLRLERRAKDIRYKASLCGQYEVVRLLLESGAICRRDTFQGERYRFLLMIGRGRNILIDICPDCPRCLYNALNNRIRSLLLQYDYSKTTHPLQPFASHLVSLLSQSRPETSDIVVNTATQSFRLHKFVLSARSPYFRQILSKAPEIASWELPYTTLPQAFETTTRFLYLGDIPAEFLTREESTITSIDELCKHLEIEGLLETITESEDRKLAQQRRVDEIEKGRLQLEEWFRKTVLNHKIVLETNNVDGVRWCRDNPVFADVLLRADEDPDSYEANKRTEEARDTLEGNTSGLLNGLPVGPMLGPRSSSRSRQPRKSTLYPVHRAMLIRSDFFMTMFNSSFREAQRSEYLQIIPINCSPSVLEAVLAFLYTEKAELSLDLAVDVLFAADLLLIEKLKVRAAAIISTLGNDSTATRQPLGERPSNKELEKSGAIDIYDIIRTGWLTRVHRLEEFGAKYLADRLEDYIDDEEFAELIKESAERIKQRQETDSIELLDEYVVGPLYSNFSNLMLRHSIRHYLSERFRLRFEDSGLEQMMAENGNEAASESKHDTSQGPATGEQECGGDGFDPTSSETRTGGQPLSGDQGLSSTVRTIDGEAAGEECATDARTYQMLLGKIESLLDRLKLDA